MASADFCFPLRKQTSRGKFIFFQLIMPDLHITVTVGSWAFPFIAGLPLKHALYLISIRHNQFLLLASFRFPFTRDTLAIR